MGFLETLSLGYNSEKQAAGTSVPGRGGSYHNNVSDALGSYFAPSAPMKDPETGYYGTAQQIHDKAKANGMGAAELQKLDQRLAGMSNNFRF